MSADSGGVRAGLISVFGFDELWDVERKIYDFSVKPGEEHSHQLPFPIPVRGLGYAAAVGLLFFLVLSRLPGVGDLIGVVPVIPRFALLAGLVGLLSILSVDGRRAHRIVWPALKFLGSAKHSAWFTAKSRPGGWLGFGRMVFFPDGSEPTYQNLKVVGPCRLVRTRPGRVTRFTDGTVEVCDLSDQPGVRSGFRPRLLTVPAGTVVQFRKATVKGLV